MAHMTKLEALMEKDVPLGINYITFSTVIVVFENLNTREYFIQNKKLYRMI